MFEQILGVLKEATASVVPVTVNMKGGVLDCRGNREYGLHVIAIGGLALSRRLTLEGPYGLLESVRDHILV
jgi:hypothetical protein